MKKYEVGNKVASSTEYLSGLGWMIDDKGYIFVSNLSDEFGWDYKIKYVPELKEKFKAADGTAAELRVLYDAAEFPENYGLTADDVVASPTRRFNRCGFEELTAGYLKAIRIDDDDSGIWFEVSRLPKRVYFDLESADYVDENFEYIGADSTTIVNFDRYYLNDEVYLLHLVSKIQFQGPWGEETLSALAVDEDGDEYSISWAVDLIENADGSIAHITSWDNPVDITKA